MARRLGAGARRAVGAGVLLVYLAAYIALAATLGSHLAGAPEWGRLLYFAAAGFVWVFPLRPLFRWMNEGGLSS